MTTAHRIVAAALAAVLAAPALAEPSAAAKDMTSASAASSLKAMIVKITDGVSVAPQLTPEQVAEAAAMGFRIVVNNRPDDEAPGQPSGASIAAAATSAGMAYTPIPIDHSGFSLEQVEAMQAAMKDGPVLAFCRSGTRSTNLWALAAAKNGGDPDAIIAAARAGGYDVSGLRPLLKQLSGK